MIDNGDYVLATKYDDGDPKDHWCVGFYSGQTNNGRSIVVDEFETPFRNNGFRRVEKVSQDVGEWFVRHAANIELADSSIWGHCGIIVDPR